MEEPNWKTCSEKELWEFVASHLATNGIDTVLVGGSVVSIYSGGLYQSGDIDLVYKNYSLKEDFLKKIMKQIGFIRKSGRYYSHPKCKHITVEFLSPPVAIGNDYNIIPEEIPVENTIIKVLGPTDCIKDRIASYIYFQSRECLDQALLVAQKHPFSMKEIERWCKAEGKEGIIGWKEFISEYKLK